MRTDEEILARITEIESEDVFGFERSDLMEYLSFEAAKGFLRKEVRQEEWDEVHPVLSKESVMKQIIDYLPFAWDKANNCRGLSAARSLHHLRAWLWLLGEDNLSKSMFPYTRYGKKQLVLVSEFVGFTWQSEDSGCWKNDEFDEGITAEAGLKEHNEDSGTESVGK